MSHFQKTIKYTSLSFLIGMFATACASLDRLEINNVNRIPPEQLQLQPQLDLYAERIDVIRNETTNSTTNGVEPIPYHTAGFYLGNGLFYDLNGNLTIMPLKILTDLNPYSFKVLKTNNQLLFNASTSIQRTENNILRKPINSIGFTKTNEIRATDSLMIYAAGKLAEQTMTLQPNGSYKYHKPLASHHIKVMPHGFYIKKLIGRSEYTCNKNTLSLDGQILIKQSDNIIEIYEKGWSKNQLRFQMIFTKDIVYLYSDKFTGLKIENKDGGMRIYRNKRLLTTYEIQTDI